jgi:hypothetical protein
MTMTEGERVRVYLMGMGTEVDPHTPHFHGGTMMAMGMRTDVVNLPASVVTCEIAAAVILSMSWARPAPRVAVVGGSDPKVSPGPV